MNESSWSQNPSDDYKNSIDMLSSRWSIEVYLDESSMRLPLGDYKSRGSFISSGCTTMGLDSKLNNACMMNPLWDEWILAELPMFMSWPGSWNVTDFHYKSTSNGHILNQLTGADNSPCHSTRLRSFHSSSHTLPSSMRVHRGSAGDGNINKVVWKSCRISFQAETKF